MLNKVELIGRLGRDPEIRHMQNGGGKVATLSVATTESWKDRQTGERRERTEWHRVVVFAPNLCTFIERSVVKGSLVFVLGQLQTRKWQDQGQDRYATEVVLQPFKSELVLLSSPSGGRNDAPPDDDEISY